MRWDYEASKGRVALSLIVGMIAGGLLTLTTALPPWRWISFSADALPIFGVFTVVAAGICAVGLLVSAPIWWLLHRRGHRGPVAALLLGATMTGAAFLPFAGYILRPFGDDENRTVWEGRLTAGEWPQRVLASLQMSVAGGVTGLIVWRVAYRRSRRRADPA